VVGHGGAARLEGGSRRSRDCHGGERRLSSWR
jgi:hypothetical protein